VEVRRFELLTLDLQSRCSTAELYPQVRPGSEMVGLSGLEPLTLRLSGVCSNHLSYKPIKGARDICYGTVNELNPQAQLVVDEDPFGHIDRNRVTLDGQRNRCNTRSAMILYLIIPNRG
jgi:hypothetical protein